MSKSKGNVVAPEPILERVGSDVFRCYLMFSGDYTQGGDWSDKGIAGIERFISRLWRLVKAVSEGKPTQETEIPREIDRKLHQTIKAVSADLQDFHFNTGLARLMELTNSIYGWVGSDLKDVSKNPAVISVIETLIKMIAPFAPHLSEEMWELQGHSQTIFDEAWPGFDEEKAKEDNVTVAIQINGKLRGTIDVEINAEESKVIEMTLALEKIQPFIEGKQIVKKIVVPNKIVNIVVK